MPDADAWTMSDLPAWEMPDLSGWDVPAWEPCPDEAAALAAWAAADEAALAAWLGMTPVIPGDVSANVPSRTHSSGRH
jgi:hypothetical protein